MAHHNHSDDPTNRLAPDPAQDPAGTAPAIRGVDAHDIAALLGTATWWRRVLWTVLGPVPLVRRRDVLRSLAVLVGAAMLFAAVGFGFVKLGYVFGPWVVIGLLTLVLVARYAIGDLVAVLAYRHNPPQITVWFDNQSEPVLVNDAVTDLVTALHIEPDLLGGVEITDAEVRRKVIEMANVWNRIAVRAGIAEPPSLQVDPYLGGTAMLREHPRQRPWLAVPVELFDAPPSVVRWVFTHEAAHLLVGDQLRGRILMGLLDWTVPAATYSIATGVGLALLIGAPGWLMAAGLVAAVAGAARLVAALWCREREHAADSIAAHVLGEPLTTPLISEFYERMAPGGISPLRTHSTWWQRLDHLNAIRHAIGLPHTDQTRSDIDHHNGDDAGEVRPGRRP